MNITIFTHSYIPNIGGLEEAIRNLAQEFLRKSHKISIVVFSSKKKFKSFEIIEEVPVYRFKAPFSILPRPGIKGIADIVKLLFSLPFVLIRLAKLLRNNKSQIAHIQFIGINAFYVWVLSFFVSLKFVVTLQGFNVHVLPFLGNIRAYLVRAIFRRILKKACFVTACSQYLLNDAIKRIPTIKHKAIVIPNGINIDEFSHNGQVLIKYPYILCLGRLDAPFKGFDVALLAFKDILDYGFDIDLVLTGDGPADSIYREFAKLLGIEKKVHFFGVADRQETVNLFRNCQFFVMPSRIEPFGIVNLEAMACAKAIIASRSGGIPEVVEDGLTGLLVEPSNVSELAAKIKLLLEDKDLRERLGKNGRHRLKSGKFSWPTISPRYLELYTKVL